jgi:hypothetical protein
MDRRRGASKDGLGRERERGGRERDEGKIASVHARKTWKKEKV